jgi:hypothetical protein
MAKYFEELDRHVEATGTTVIKGAPLEVGADHPLRAKGYFPVLSPTCVCVTDPCPCDDIDNLIVWLPETGVRSRKATQLKNKSGETLHEFHVMRDADLITETFTRKKAASFDPRARNVASNGKVLRAVFGSMRQMRLSTTCAGNTLYIVVEGADGSGGTMFEYIPIGSCETTSS